MSRYLIDERGPHLMGCFYELPVPADAEDKECGDHCVYIPDRDGQEDHVYATVISAATENKYNCPLNPSHVTQSVLTGLEVELHGGGISPIVPAFGYLLVRADLAQRLRRSSLCGFEVIPVDVSAFGLSQDIFAVTYLGPDILRDGAFEPPGSNRCPSCGHAPIICPACGTSTPNCPRCGTRCITYESDDRPDRIVVTPIPDAGPVIDAAKFEGSDFFATRSTNIVSRRAFDFFKENGAGPLVALPLRTYIDSYTEQQLAEVRKLLP